MLDSGSSCLWALSLLGVALFVSTSVVEGSAISNRIAAPGQALYYQLVDAGPLVAPNESLKRTNRSLLKWWDDLFPRNNNNCCNNYNNGQYPPAAVAPSPLVNNNCNNGLLLQDLDPFKELKLFKKLPDLFPAASPCGLQCGGGCGQQTNYAAPLTPSYQSADAYAQPNPEYNGPGDGDAGYVAPAPAPAPAYEAPAPPPPASYDEPAPLAPAYDPPAPPAATYESVPPPASYEPAPPSSYAQTEPASDGYGKGVQQNYVAAAPPPQIVYQPIIYLSASPAPQPAIDQGYASHGPAPAPAPVPVYEALPPTPSYYQPPAPPASPSYSTPACQTPIRLSLIDQPYRVAPELFEEYNYRLAQNLL